MRSLRTAGLLLAAGRSSRMKMGGKLIRPLHGKPLVRHAAVALLLGGIRRLFAVVGPDGGEVERALEGLGVAAIVNPYPEKGMASSLSAGIAFLGEEFSSVLVMPGDMPILSPSTVELLMAAFAGSEKTIAVPLYRGRRGHPVLFDLPAHRQALLSLTGDRGARDILAAERENLLEVPVEDPGVLADVDTEEDLESLAEEKWKSEK